MEYRCLHSSEKVVGFPGAVITGGCELPNVGASNQT